MPGTSSLPAALSSAKGPVLTKQRQLYIAQSFNLLRNALLILFLLRWTRKSYLQFRGYGLGGSILMLYNDIRRRLFSIFVRLPIVQTRIRAEVDKTILGLEAKLVPSGPGVTKYTSLPAHGWTTEQIRGELEKLSGMEHTRWEEGRVSGAVYHGGIELSDLQAEAFRKFGVANPIHPDVFPGVRKMEAEVVSMVLGLFNAPEGAAGATSSGGTESILMAVLAARQKAYVERGITEPEMILPYSAHTAFRKAGEYFGIKIHLAPCPAPSYQVSTTAVARLINRNTILLVGSAPNYPHGIVDEIPKLSRLALHHRIPLHVDCCLGSFVIAMLSKAGFDSPDFDFSVEGVTSISVDTHKYGFAPKGNSCILYRTAAMRRYQYYVCPDWSGGVYASPGLAGSRPGALIAGCWTSLMMMGEAGYIDTCVKIVNAAKRLEDAVRTTPMLRKSLRVIGKPQVSVVAFRAEPLAKFEDAVDIYAVADGMSNKGWHLNALQDPPGIHVAVTIPIVAVIEDMIKDLEEVVQSVQGKGVGKGNTAALYGVAGALPDKSVVRELAEGFLNALYKT